MLHALLEYAKQAKISAEAGFKPKPIRWLLQFDSSGEYLGLLPASDDRKAREFPNVPHLQFTSGTPMRQFLVDTATYMLLYGEEAPDEKLQAKHRYCLELLRNAAKVEPVLGHISETLTNPTVRRRIHADLDQQRPKAKPSDNVTFVEMSDDGPRILVEQSTWHDWWRAYWPGLFEKKTRRKKTGTMRCFLSGELVVPRLTHPKIKGLGDVGGKVQTTLVGFNRDAFCSYGLKKSSNAAVSTELAETYAAALNELIDKQSKRLAGTKVVYWYTHDVPRQDDPLAQLLEGIDFGEAESPPPRRPRVPASCLTPSAPANAPNSGTAATAP